MLNLLGLSLLQLQKYVDSIGYKKFHALQIFKWIHYNGVDSFDSMYTLSKSLRLYLKQHCNIKLPSVFKQTIATDGVYKWLLSLDDDNKIEMVFIPEDKRGTLCISSQVGCALNCHFCSTGAQGFNRHLSTDEIIGQLWLANSILDGFKNNSVITNIVFMGMGEPFANYDNVLPAIQTMLHKDAYNLSYRKVTVSTVGIIPKIYQLAQDCPVSLAISLHAPTDELRSKIMPINKKYPIKDLLLACKEYLKYAPKSLYITFEYVMLANVNDHITDANKLIELIKRIRCKVNLIPFNIFPKTVFLCSKKEQILQFQEVLNNAGIVATIRKTRGDKIDAACGQLVGKVLERKRKNIMKHVD